MFATRSALVLALLALPATALAQAQLSLVALGKQILQNVALGSVKNELIASLAGMGCSGSTIASLAAAANAGGAKGAASAALGPRSGPGGMDPAAMQRAMEMAQKQMGMQLTPEQQAMMKKAMQQMQTASAQPLSPIETTAVFDELAGLGLISEPLRKEANQCISAAPPGSADAVGSAGAMIRSTVLPAAHEAKSRMASLTPDEQNQLADGIVDALNSASPSDRKAFFDGIGLGFFPPAVVEQVRSRVKP